jgi:hypothetical protein
VRGRFNDCRRGQNKCRPEGVGRVEGLEGRGQTRIQGFSLEEEGHVFLLLGLCGIQLVEGFQTSTKHYCSANLEGFALFAQTTKTILGLLETIEVFLMLDFSGVKGGG